MQLRHHHVQRCACVHRRVVITCINMLCTWCINCNSVGRNSHNAYSDPRPAKWLAMSFKRFKKLLAAIMMGLARLHRTNEAGRRATYRFRAVRARRPCGRHRDLWLSRATTFVAGVWSLWEIGLWKINRLKWLLAFWLPRLSSSLIQDNCEQLLVRRIDSTHKVFDIKLSHWKRLFLFYYW